MSRELHFNICGIKTSHFSDLSRAKLRTKEDKSADREMPSEDMLTPVPRSRGCVSEELRYASTHWLDHLMRVQIMDDDLKKELKSFLKERLLFWLEVLCFCEELDVIDKFYTRLRAPSVSCFQVTQS